MKIPQIVIICATLLLNSKCAKNGDEGKPYEFGFTIDGEQHRYEKRDANGIIQGEFGFITADGIYHVTTYATDENGSFRILSTRNVRISDPLDGSGGGHGQKVPISEVQGAGKKPQQIQQSVSPINQNRPPPSTTPTVLSHVNQVISTTTKRAQFVFMTQSTIKPACASCGYVTYPSTTPKPVTQYAPQQFPLNKPNGNPILQNGPAQFSQAYSTTTPSPLIPTNSLVPNNNYKPGVYSPNVIQQPQVPPAIIPQTQPIPISHNNLVVNVNGGSKSNGQLSSQKLEPSQIFFPNNPPQSLPAGPSDSISIGKPNNQFMGSISSSGLSIPSPQSNAEISAPNFQPNGGLTEQFSSPPLGPAISGQQPSAETPSPYVQPPAISQQQPQSPENANLFSPISSPTPSFPEVNNIPGSQISSQLLNQPKIPERSKASDIKVENGMIIVPNNPPIVIKDKYPGMVDGLPKGIEESDIKDLLYKFNYTIGFHGHYEKGYKDGSKVGGYFVNGRDGISRVVTYVADEYGYRPKFKLINLGLESPDTPKEETEKTFGLKNFEFVWYPLI